ncbi:MAG: AAA family ATPase [Chloroflexi bacterium]|nr:AAA family ATPase [Chloroflexota bacterium]
MVQPQLTPATLIGRESELSQIGAAFARARTGQACAALISGEAGSGKTRLMREIVARLEGGWRVAEGYALPGQGAPPYYALGRALRRLSSDLDPGTEGLAEILPLLAAVGVVEAAVPPAHEPPADDGRLRLFEAMARFVDLAAGAAPVVIALDDMQWAAQGDWEAIAHIVRVATARVVVLLASREAGLWEAGSPAVNALLELNRQRLLVDIRLDALSAGELAELCTALLSGPASSELAGFVFARSSGNPFFAEEVLVHMLRTGSVEQRDGRWELIRSARDVVPATVRLTTAQSVSRLSAGARDALNLGAVAGRMFGASLLSSAGGEHHEIEAWMGDAASLGLLKRLGPGLWSFRHDLIREAVLAEIDPGKRAGLHRAVATALSESPHPAGDVERLEALVYHWQEAHDDHAAAAAAIDASRAARGAYAPEEALQLAEAAYTAAERLAAGQQTADPLLREALLRLGEARVDAGRLLEAEESFMALLSHAQASKDRALEGQAWLRIGTVAHRREQPLRAAEAFSRALATLETMPGQATGVGRALVELASIAGLTTAEYSSAEEYANRAVAVARAIHDHGLEAEGLIALANSRARSEGPRAARPMLEEALARAEAGGHLQLAAETAAGLSNSYYWSGELRRAEEFGRKRLDLATRAHDIFGLRHAHSWLALLVATRGGWDEARDLLAQAEPMLSRLASPEPVGFIRVVSAFIHYRLGDGERASRDMDDALERLQPLGDGTMLWYGSLAALIFLAAGRVDAARAEIDRQEERLAQIGAAALPARSARTALGLAYAELGEAAAAARCADALAGFDNDFHWSPARRTLAAAAALEGKTAASLAYLDAAEQQARIERLRPDLGLILLARAQLVVEATARMAALTEASDIFAELRMVRELAIAAQLLKSGPANRLPGGLTAREREVVCLVAQGLTNREIAEKLVLSERTVINHVSHIFQKLGVDNRAGATAFAIRNQLL